MKMSLDYFSTDTDFYEDPKFLEIEELFGFIGPSVVHRLLCFIYGKQGGGWCIEWNRVNARFFFLKKIKKCLDEDQLRQLIEMLLEVEFFDRRIFDNYGLLTSKGIQDRWVEAGRRESRIKQIPDSCRLVNLDGTRRKPSEHVETCNDTSEHVETCNDTSEHVETCNDTSEHVETCCLKEKKRKENNNKQKDNYVCDIISNAYEDESGFTFDDYMPVINIWNQVFPKPDARFIESPELQIKPIEILDLNKFLKHPLSRELNRVRSAFVALKHDTDYGWQIGAAVRNIQQLVTIAEKGHTKNHKRGDGRFECVSEESEYEGGFRV